jgi:hypothetical protein
MLIGSMLDVPKDLFHGPRNDAALRIALEILEAFHGESLSGAGLAIGQDGGVVAL